MFKYLFPLLIIFLSQCAIAPVVPIAIEDLIKKRKIIKEGRGLHE